MNCYLPHRKRPLEVLIFLELPKKHIPPKHPTSVDIWRAVYRGKMWSNRDFFVHFSWISNSAIHRHFVGYEFLWHSGRAGHAPCFGRTTFLVVAKTVRKKDSEIWRNENIFHLANEILRRDWGKMSRKTI